MPAPRAWPVIQRLTQPRRRNVDWPDTGADNEQTPMAGRRAIVVRVGVPKLRDPAPRQHKDGHVPPAEFRLGARVIRGAEAPGREFA